MIRDMDRRRQLLQRAVNRLEDMTFDVFDVTHEGESVDYNFYQLYLAWEDQQIYTNPIEVEPEKDTRFIVVNDGFDFLENKKQFEVLTWSKN